MTPDQLSSKVDTIVTKFETAFGKQVDKTQAALFEQMQLLLKRLDLNADGTIIQNQANRKILAKASSYFDKAFNQSGYYEALGQSVNTIESLTGVNSAYFATIVDTFTVDAQYISNLQKQTVKQIQGLLANEGLEYQMKGPLLDILNQNVNTGAAYSDLLSQMRGFTLGTDQLQGQLQRYSRQITTDTLFNYNRALQEAISQKAGLEWYNYVGGKDKDSRDFCLARAGKYFKKDIIESWASIEWDGKRRGTTSSTIFIYCGGHNCRHQLIPVSEAVVPKKYLK